MEQSNSRAYDRFGYNESGFETYNNESLSQTELNNFDHEKVKMKFDFLDNYEYKGVRLWGPYNTSKPELDWSFTKMYSNTSD